MHIMSRYERLRLDSYKESYGPKSSKEAFERAMNLEQMANNPGSASREYLMSKVEAYLQYAVLLELNGE